MSKKKILSIVSLNLALPLLFGSLSVYAEVSGSTGNGEVIPSVTYINVIDDEEKFAEDHWIQRGFSGGVSDFNVFKEYKNGDTVELEGKGIAGNGDYFFDFDFKKEGLGGINFEFKEFKKYYDGTGGYFQRFTPTTASPKTYLETDRDLFLTIGNLKVEGVLEKENSPKFTFAYEREYRKGAKSLISWGAVVGNGYTRNIGPTFLETDEIVDNLEVKVEHTIKGVDLSVEQSWEGIKVQNQKVNNRTFTLATGAFTNVRYKYEDLDADSYTTVVRAAKELNEKVFFSTAFLYNRYRGHTKERITDTSTATSNENHPLNPARVYQDTITLLPKISILVLENLFLDADFRWEWVSKNGKADYNRDKGATPDGTIDERLIIKDEIGENRLGEAVNIKYDGIKDIVLYTRAEFEQQSRNDKNSQDSSGSSATNSNNFYRDTNTVTYYYDSTSGFKWYPMQKASVTGEFKYKYGFRDYKFGDRRIETGDITNGYRGFLDSISSVTYRPIVIVSYKPFKWLACNFRYCLDNTIYGVRTRRAEAAQFAEYRANIYSGGATITPCDSFYATFLYQYKEASTGTQANGSNSRSNVNQPTYDANVKVLSASCGYSPVKNVTIKGSYSFSQADNFDDFSGIGLPLEIDNFSQNASIEIENKITKDCSLEFKYDFMQYDETSNAGIDNYMAHLFYTALKMKF